MSAESGKRGPERVEQTGTRPLEQEQLPCPRCDSTNTKFCYYNNYNLSQPRHFCKSCRRYWTRGGTLRNVPVGGGTRKTSNKRLLTSNTSLSPSSTLPYDPIPTNPVSIIPGFKPDIGSGYYCGEVDMKEPLDGGFASLMSTTTQQEAGLVSLSRFGLGVGSGLHGLGFGLGTWDWPLEQVGDGEGDGSISGTSSGCNTWPIGGV